MAKILCFNLCFYAIFERFRACLFLILKIISCLLTPHGELFGPKTQITPQGGVIWGGVIRPSTVQGYDGTEALGVD